MYTKSRRFDEQTDMNKTKGEQAMIENTWTTDAIIRAFERGLTPQDIQESLRIKNSLEDIKAIIREKYPMTK